jgi:hypothetical protein
VVKQPANIRSYFEYDRPREGNWGYHVELKGFSGGLSGNDEFGYSANLEPTYFISDAFNVYVGLFHSRTPDWLVWQRQNLIGSFDGKESHFSAGFNWIVSNRQELRLKLQAIAVNADIRQGYRVDPTGNAVPTDETVEDFSVRTLGVQLRYRYEFAPLSFIYVVYGRGGYEQATDDSGSGRLLRDSFNLRDDDQLLIKLSYRFES